MEFLDAKEYAVAFLAQTLTLENDAVDFRPRRQPLRVKPGMKLIAVTRIESATTTKQTAALTEAQREKLVNLILKTLEFKNVAAIQIDFDAVVSEREFYRALLFRLRQILPADVPLSITALASFCIGDRWMSDLPISEAVPMIFRMGADDQTVKDFLAKGNDFSEPLCRKSYGVATDELLTAKLDRSRRLYVFKGQPQAWTPNDIQTIEKLFR